MSWNMALCCKSNQARTSPLSSSPLSFVAPNVSTNTVEINKHWRGATNNSSSWTNKPGTEGKFFLDEDNIERPVWFLSRFF